jgi:2-polyprenyl-3-methyl-5-hydroxy-6-metoxy-1,4-benzoquinol methylase
MEDQSTILKSKIGYFHSQRPEMRKYIPEDAIRILDVGCSDGAFCASIRQGNREIWGVELNKEAAKLASEVCDHVLVGEFNEIYDQLPKNYFDCVFFNDVLEHLYSPWDTINLVKSLLSDKGVLISSIPNFRYIANLITEVVWEGEFKYKPEGGILDDTHIRFFTSKSIVRMFHEQGYEVLIHEGIKPCKSWKEKLFINLTFGILKDSRYKQFATVAKPVDK